jgi:hypothetical protein
MTHSKAVETYRAALIASREKCLADAPLLEREGVRMLFSMALSGADRAEEEIKDEYGCLFRALRNAIRWTDGGIELAHEEGINHAYRGAALVCLREFGLNMMRAGARD